MTDQITSKGPSHLVDGACDFASLEVCIDPSLEVISILRLWYWSPTRMEYVMFHWPIPKKDAEELKETFSERDRSIFTIFKGKP